ncbi:MAG: glycogen synthase GlgA [Opitutaceae bacterium]
MKIVHAASELFPFVKTGGLADAVASQAKALAAFGHETAVILPGYRAVLDHPDFKAAKDELAIVIEMGDDDLHCGVFSLKLGPRLTLYVVRRDEYYDRRFPYGVGNRDYDDNAARFVFFDKAIVEILRLAKLKADVVHCHDWQTGLVPVLLRAAEQQHGETLAIGTVMTVHNIAFQGVYPARDFALTNLPADFFAIEGLEFYGQMSMLKAGLVFADRITTVSPTYAREICIEKFGCGLEGVIRPRSSDLVGLLNGIDTDVWNPATDRLIPANFSVDDLSGKAVCRRELLRSCGFDPAFEGPVFGMVCRLADQKGLDLVLACRDFFMTNDVRLVILGRGDARYETALRQIAASHPDRLALSTALDEPMSHLIEAGADFFLMPSIFEPCGLNQMYSLHYGTVPIVTRVGGLADTVADIESNPAEGTGIVVEPDAAALRHGLKRALALHADPVRMVEIIRRGMRRDFSWTYAARAYEALYRDIV